VRAKAAAVRAKAAATARAAVDSVRAAATARAAVDSVRAAATALAAEVKVRAAVRAVRLHRIPGSARFRGVGPSGRCLPTSLRRGTTTPLALWRRCQKTPRISTSKAEVVVEAARAKEGAAREAVVMVAAARAGRVEAGRAAAAMERAEEGLETWKECKRRPLHWTAAGRRT
jgi:hypothetical protein